MAERPDSLFPSYGYVFVLYFFWVWNDATLGGYSSIRMVPVSPTICESNTPRNKHNTKTEKGISLTIQFQFIKNYIFDFK